MVERGKRSESKLPGLKARSRGGAIYAGSKHNVESNCASEHAIIRLFNPEALPDAQLLMTSRLKEPASPD
jgi:hypothetical protein